MMDAEMRYLSCIKDIGIDTITQCRAHITNQIIAKHGLLQIESEQATFISQQIFYETVDLCRLDKQQ